MNTIDHSDKILSLDAETNGLLGQPFAIAATVREGKQEVDRIILRCPIETDIDSWVEQNVIPNIADISENCKSYADMLDQFFNFWEHYRQKMDENWNPIQVQPTTIAHMGAPVETGLFKDMLKHVGNDFAGPYPLDEVATVLRLAGENPSSVDEYMKKYNIQPEFEWESHHPMYDAVVAAQVWEHITSRIESK